MIGGGAAGMTTALHAAELGVDVILLEKMDLLGGTSAVTYTHLDVYKRQLHCKPAGAGPYP